MGHEDGADHVAHPAVERLIKRDDLIERLMANMGEDWEAGEGSAESILVDYVHALEQRVQALGGNTAAHDGGQHVALGEFYAAARKGVTVDDADDWDAMMDAWDRYVRIKAAAE